MKDRTKYIKQRYLAFKEGQAQGGDASGEGTNGDANGTTPRQHSWRPRSEKYKELWERWKRLKQTENPGGHLTRECPLCTREMKPQQVVCGDCFPVVADEDARLADDAPVALPSWPAPAVFGDGGVRLPRPDGRALPRAGRPPKAQRSAAAKARKDWPNWRLILEAAKVLAGTNKRGVFGRGELVEAAWLSDKARFGLKGMEDKYPSDNKVMSVVQGSRGMVAHGLLAQVQAGVEAYTLGKNCGAK